MAKNKAIKWLVGLSSTALFTGLVGISQKYDINSVKTASTEPGGGNSNNSNQDQASQDVFPNSGTDDWGSSPGSQPGTDDDYSKGGREWGSNDFSDDSGFQSRDGFDGSGFSDGNTNGDTGSSGGEIRGHSS